MKYKRFQTKYYYIRKYNIINEPQQPNNILWYVWTVWKDLSDFTRLISKLFAFGTVLIMTVLSLLYTTLYDKLLR